MSSKNDKDKYIFKINQQTGKNYFRVMAEILSCDDFYNLQECFLTKRINAKTQGRIKTKPEQNNKQNLW